MISSSLRPQPQILYGSISNIGYNPTFGENELVAETHIFDFNDDIYGQPIRLNLLRHLRGEVKFNSVAELSAQIRKDIEAARQTLDNTDQERMLSCEKKFDRWLA